MIAAKPIRPFQFCFHQYNRRLIERQFHTIHISKRSLSAPPPFALFIANHSSWWDGLICFHINRMLLHHSAYYMMHESGLQRYPFFRYLGAFSVNRSNPKDVMKSLQYGVERLKQQESVWIFPQGDEKHLEIRPLSFLPGFLYIAEKVPDVPIVPVTYYYSFGHEKQPELFIELGTPFSHDELNGSTRAEKAAHAEQLLTAQLDQMKKSIIQEQSDEFIPLTDWKWQAWTPYSFSS